MPRYEYKTDKSPYEPCEFDIDGTIYAIPYPITTEIMNEYWRLANESLKLTKEIEAGGIDSKKIADTCTDDSIDLILKIGKDKLTGMDHLVKQEIYSKISDYFVSIQKKNIEKVESSR